MISLNLSPAKLATRALIALAFTFSLLAFNAARADALPGALRITVIDSLCVSLGNTADDLTLEMGLEPGVQGVNRINAGRVSDGGSGTTPTASSLEAVDAVVALSDCPWADPAALGNLLADFQDRGGVVIAPNDNFWSPLADPGYSILGRWSTGGYSPINQNIAEAEHAVTLGAFDSTNPIFAGVSSLTNAYSYAGASAAPGAVTVANWADGSVAVALKGQALGFNGWLGDGNGGTVVDGKFVVNAIKALAPQVVRINISGAGKGVVNNGNCSQALLCTLTGIPGRQLSIQALELAGSVFTGWTGGCTGNASTCVVTVGYPGNIAAARVTPPVGATFALTKIKLGSYSKHKLSVTVPGAGKLTIKGTGIKTASQKVSKSGTVKIKLKASGKAKKKLDKGGSAKVKLKVTFVPSGARSGSTVKKTVQLRR